MLMVRRARSPAMKREGEVISVTVIDGKRGEYQAFIDPTQVVSIESDPMESPAGDVPPTEVHLASGRILVVFESAIEMSRLVEDDLASREMRMEQARQRVQKGLPPIRRGK